MRYDDGIKDIVVPHRVTRRHDAFTFDAGRAKRVEDHTARVRRGVWTFSTKVWCPDRPELGILRIDAMAEAVGQRPGKVGSAAYVGHRAGGLRFARAGKQWQRSQSKTFQAVVCVESGRRFDTVQDAANWCGQKSRNGINEAIKKGTTAGGYHWRHDGQPAPTASRRIKRRGGVVCVETGVWYPGAAAAARVVGANAATAIDNAIRRKGRCMGYRWRHAEAKGVAA